MKKILYSLIALIIIIQFIPVDKSNPPSTYTVNWDSPQTKEFAKRACYDCHSNETRWPWYSNIAPVSWLVAYDVNEGKEHLNFSTGKLDDAHESAEELLEGKMPLKKYIFLHPEARLTDAEKKQFAEGLKKTFPSREKSIKNN